MSLVAHGFGVILNETLEVLLRIFVRLENDDVTFRQEVPHEEPVEAAEHRQSVERLDVLAVVKYVFCGKDDPGENKQQQAEGDGFGLVVVFGKIFPHVGEDEAKGAQGPQQNHRTRDRPKMTHLTAEYDLIRVPEGFIVGRRGSVSEADEKQQSLSHKRHGDDEPLSVILHPPSVEPGELGSHFENTNDLKRAHDKGGQARSVEQQEGHEPQDTEGGGRLAKVEEDADAAETEAGQNEEAHGPPC